MKTLRKFTAFALLLMLSTTTFAKGNNLSANVWYKFSPKSFNSFTTQYEARVHVIYTQTAPGIYTYNIWLDIVDQAVQTPLVVPGSFTLSISLNTIGTTVTSHSMTIATGHTTSPFTTFIADHVLSFADFRGWDQSATSYNGIPISPNYYLQ